MVLIAPAHHPDMKALERHDNWISSTSCFITLAHKHDSLCKIHAVDRLEKMLDRRYSYFHIIAKENIHMWGRQHHDIGFSILSQAEFWAILRRYMRPGIADAFIGDCRTWHIGECHFYDAPAVVMPNTWSSSFAHDNAFCCLVFLVCRDMLSRSFQLYDSRHCSTGQILALIQDKFSRRVPADCDFRTKQSLTVWCDMMKHGSHDCSFLIHVPLNFQYNSDASMLSQYCHATLHGAVHAKPRKSGFPNNISHGPVLHEPPVVFSKCCNMGQCVLLEMHKTEKYVGYWSIKWGVDDRSTLMMGFMDMILLEVKQSWPYGEPVVRFVYGAFIQDDHSAGKGKHHRDAVRAITFICDSHDAEFCCQADADYTIITITALRTSGQFKAAQRWHSALLQQPEYFQLACAAANVPLRQVSALTQGFTTWMHQNYTKLTGQQQLCIGSMFVPVDGTVSNVSVVVGPPGTGKTTLIVTFVQLMHYWRSNTDKSPTCVNILVVATTYEAGANVAERLCGQSYDGFEVCLLLAGSREAACRTRFSKTSLLVFTVATFSAHMEKQSAVSMRVVITTYGQTFANDTPFNSTLRCLRNKFHYAFSDEAGQVPALDVLPTLACFDLKQTHWCIVGDPRQLPPFSGNGHETRNLLHAVQQKQQPQMLQTQRRMIPGLGDVVSHMFYDGLLRTDVTLDSSIVPFAMIILDNHNTTCRCDLCVVDNHGRGNIHEARVVHQLVKAYGGASHPFVLAYYAVQKKILLDCGINKGNVSTIDAVQGRQYSDVIITTGRSHGVGFSGDRRRINVGLSRGERSSIIVTTSSLCNESRLWRLISWVADAMWVVRRVSMHPVAEKGVLRIVQLLRFLQTTTFTCTVQQVMALPYEGSPLQNRFNDLDCACVGSLQSACAATFNFNKPDEQVEFLTHDDVTSEISESDQCHKMNEDELAACAAIQEQERIQVIGASLADLTQTYAIVRFTKLHKLQPYLPEHLRNADIGQAEFFQQLCHCLGSFLHRACVATHSENHPLSKNQDCNVSLALLGLPASRLDSFFPHDKNLCDVANAFSFGVLEDHDTSINRATAFVKAMLMGGAAEMPIYKHTLRRTADEVLADKEPKTVLFAGTHAMSINNWKPQNKPSNFNLWSKSLVLHATLSRAMVTALTSLGDLVTFKNPLGVEVTRWNVTIPPQALTDDAARTDTKKRKVHLPKEDAHEVCMELVEADGLERGRGDTTKKFYSLDALYTALQRSDLPPLFHDLGRRTAQCVINVNNA